MPEPSPNQTGRIDLEIVSRCLPGTVQPAWKEFFARFGPLMNKWISGKHRTGQREDWEDIYQAIALKILSHEVLPGFDVNQRNFRRFLYSVVVNYIVDEYRKSQRTEPLKDDHSMANEVSMMADGYPPRSYDQLFAAIWERLEALDPDAPTVLIYTALLEDRPSSEIAEMAGVSESTVSRCRKRLRPICRSVLGLPDPGSKNK